MLLAAMVFLGPRVEGNMKAPVWCAQSTEAFNKCKMISNAYSGKLKCLLGLGEVDCYKKIASGLADISSFDGGSIFDAGKKYGLKVIMSERLKSLAAGGTKYFAVAVVKASSTLTFATLKGARSCHTGVQKSSGWILPVGILLNSKVMPCIGGDQYASVADFFSASCAPGASNVKYNKGLHDVKKLCQLCIGEGLDKCARNSREPYYGYEGAFQCMKDDRGDVAFIKQSILTSLSQAEQRKYKLLCPDNTVAEPKDYLKCRFAGAPAHGVLTRKNATLREIVHYQTLMERAAARFGPGSLFSIFDGKVFSKRAIGLDRTPIAKMPYEKYLGDGYVKAISSLEGCT